jgi:hypothetical protein
MNESGTQLVAASAVAVLQVVSRKNFFFNGVHPELLLQTWSPTLSPKCSYIVFPSCKLHLLLTTLPQHAHARASAFHTVSKSLHSQRFAIPFRLEIRGLIRWHTKPASVHLTLPFIPHLYHPEDKPVELCIPFQVKKVKDTRTSEEYFSKRIITGK